MSKLKDVLKRVFARRHSDIWAALQDYANSKGIRVDDALAAAVSAYLAADEEGKETLGISHRELKACDSPRIPVVFFDESHIEN